MLRTGKSKSPEERETTSRQKAAVAAVVALHWILLVDGHGRSVRVSKRAVERQTRETK
jgi:hypothetical protein